MVDSQRQNRDHAVEELFYKSAESAHPRLRCCSLRGSLRGTSHHDGFRVFCFFFSTNLQDSSYSLYYT
ncbi:hypothetical protein GBAR_LOCUS30669 [Geodia barretti]|uniref:Uncharacterized protein n=1 Tax=Geodia barretti TaxID=519541 RepID=A0AA35TYR6_GEOBA|nr:hypothetical protein GBAR_LOCUS30669 [Geodia barretti]